jgi:hypothetical protein
MAGDKLVGNMHTALMITYFEEKHLLLQIEKVALEKAMIIADQFFI